MDINVFAKFYEIPSLCFHDIEYRSNFGEVYAPAKNDKVNKVEK